MSNVFFTSDWHVGHRNILQYSNRPFPSVEDMNEALVENHNRVVKSGDRVYHLGDFCLGSEELAVSTVKRLNGQKFLVFGNHDKHLRKSERFLSQWIWARDLTQVEVGDQKIILCHFAMRSWNQSHRGSWQLYGHSHGSLPDDPHALSLDVGVDAGWNYIPAAYEDVKALMSKKTWKAIDHHQAY